MTACGDLLKTFIAESGKLPKAIAAQAGITSPYLILLQQGQRKPSDEVVLALAKALELDPHQTKRLQEAAQLDRSTQRQLRPKHLNGIVRVHPALPEETFGEWVCTATQRVWILQTWVARAVRYKDALLTAAQNHAADPDFTIRILLLDPHTGVAEQRSKDILILSLDELDTDEIKHYASRQIQASLDDFHMLHRIIQHKVRADTQVEKEFLEIRTHTCLPSFSLYLCDDHALIGFYLHGDISPAGPQLEVDLSVGREASPLIDMIHEEFETLWRVSRPATVS
ncbi:MAG: helix-turn-helix domain-containing protein [Chloroflexota bacterium]|nr:helix-turn-helix domain-containing protein [Chloroflexota bacterium]